jgi:hypothetical protein
VGGGHFFIKKLDDELKPHAGSNRGVRRLSLDVDVDVMAARRRSVADRCVATAGPGDENSALGVFFRFQIPDFDFFFGFFSLCHFFASPDLGLVCCFIVSGTLKST